MQFTIRKRKQTPSVIIISLIDVLIVVLIFLMVTTTFKQQPAVTLVLPESSQAKPGSKDDMLIITVPKQGPIHLGREPVTLDKLKEKLMQATAKNPETTLAIRADTDAPFGTIIKIMDVAKAAKFKSVSTYTKSGAQP